MDPDQTALGEQSALDLICLFKRLHNISIDDKTYDCVVIYALRVNKCGFSALTDRTDFHEMHTDLRGSSNF